MEVFVLIHEPLIGTERGVCLVQAMAGNRDDRVTICSGDTGAGIGTVHVRGADISDAENCSGTPITIYIEHFGNINSIEPIITFQIYHDHSIIPLNIYADHRFPDLGFLPAGLGDGVHPISSGRLLPVALGAAGWFEIYHDHLVVLLIGSIARFVDLGRAMGIITCAPLRSGRIPETHHNSVTSITSHITRRARHDYSQREENIVAHAGMLGMAAAQVGGGIMSGIGQGLQSWGSYMMQREFMEKSMEQQLKMMGLKFDFMKELNISDWANKFKLTDIQHRNILDQMAYNQELKGYRTGGAGYGVNRAGFVREGSRTVDIGHNPGSSSTDEPTTSGSSSFSRLLTPTGSKFSNLPTSRMNVSTEPQTQQTQTNTSAGSSTDVDPHGFSLSGNMSR